MHSVRGYRRKDGTYVRPHVARNPGRHGRRPGAQLPRHSASKPTKLLLTVSIAIAVAGSATWTVSAETGGVRTSLASNAQPQPSTVVEIKLDLDKTIAAFLVSHYDVRSAAKFGGSCQAHSYGAVRSFFKAHPCRWLARAYLALRTVGGSAILVALSWVGMPDVAQAEAYKRLVDAPGTGNITELSRDIGPYRGIRFNGLFFASGRGGKAVWDAEVQPINGLRAAVAERVLRMSRQ